METKTYYPKNYRMNGKPKEVRKRKVVWGLTSDNILTMRCRCGDFHQLAKDFPEDPQVQEMYEVWTHWNMNNLTPGTPLQMHYLLGFGGQNSVIMFGEHCYHLKSKEVYIDPTNGYEYGSSWLTREIPSNILDKINSWDYVK